MARPPSPTLPGLALLLCLAGCGDAGGDDTIHASTSSAAASTSTSNNPTDGGNTSSGDTSPDSSGGPELEKFSFFVTSLKAMKALSGSPLGFGGDLRFGEAGPGAGLRGADKICTAVAEMSMPGSASKQWRAFLSATADAEGKQVNAIDRIGDGPWYDRLGRIVAASRADLLHDRPEGADPAIQNDLPNEVRRYLLLRALALIQAARLSRRARIASPTDPPTRAPTRTPPTPWRRSPAGVAAS